MQNRIAEMHHAWGQLTLLKSIRQSRSLQDPVDGLEKLPPPPFKGGVTPLMLVVGERALHPLTELFSGNARLAEAGTGACDEDSVSMSAPVDVVSTPPKLTAERLARLSSRSIDLPELPPEDVMPAQPAPSPSPASSPLGSASSSSAVGSNMKRLRKKVSKRLSAVALDLSELAQKMSPRSGRNSPEKSSPVRRVSPTKEDPLLASLPTVERNRIAVKMAEYCQTDGYAIASPTRQALLFNGYLIGLLSAYPELIRADTLKSLRTDLQGRMRHAVVDTVVDLQDPAFSGFVRQVVNANFIKPWAHDSVDASDPQTGVKKKMPMCCARPLFVTSTTRTTMSGRLTARWKRLAIPISSSDGSATGRRGICHAWSAISLRRTSAIS